jgi:SEL1 protein
MKNMPAPLKPGACSIAAAFYKVAAERGSWDEDLIREGEDSWESGAIAGKQLALLKWWIAAERGFELGQNNMAFILDQGMSSPNRFITKGGSLTICRQKYAPPRQYYAVE